MQTIVIGHRNPDMDSICAAIGYAKFKELCGHDGVIAARCGATNERIDYVLRKFDVEAPVLITDISAKVSDVMQPKVISVHADSPVYDAIQLIDQKSLRGLPVVDDSNHCLGLLSAFKITSARVVTSPTTGRAFAKHRIAAPATTSSWTPKLSSASKSLPWPYRGQAQWSRSACAKQTEPKPRRERQRFA